MKKWLIIVISCVLGYIPNSSANESTKGDRYVETQIELSHNNPYAGELVTATLYANCFGEELSYLSQIPVPTINKGEFSFIKKVENSERPHRISDGNKDGVAIPIAKYVVKVDNPGKKMVSFTDAEGVVQYGVVRHDPFWGSYRDVEQKQVRLTTKPVDLIVKSLPINKQDVAYSGAIGDFQLSVEVPRGDIVVNDPGVVFIILSGKGYIPEEVMPDYQDAFGNKIRLRSIEGESEIFHDGKDLCSRHIWRCEIIPQNVGECEIGSVKFGCFNSRTGNYEELSSDPVVINVKSSTVKRESLDV